MIIIDIFLTALMLSPIVLVKGVALFYILGIPFYFPICVTGAVISFILPARFNVGVDKWRDANILSKLAPIIVSCVFINATKSIGQSYATILVNSLLLGFNLRYLSKVLREFIR